ncbi:MAG: hypothetical protein Q8R92_09130 [Deltaproteobacteria bacterium]|nr:hypothetical protein [Deltaproteobacteria bacterium]
MKNGAEETVVTLRKREAVAHGKKNGQEGMIGRLENGLRAIEEIARLAGESYGDVDYPENDEKLTPARAQELAQKLGARDNALAVIQLACQGLHGDTPVVD